MSSKKGSVQISRYMRHFGLLHRNKERASEREEGRKRGQDYPNRVILAFSGNQFVIIVAASTDSKDWSGRIHCCEKLVRQEGWYPSQYAYPPQYAPNDKTKRFSSETAIHPHAQLFLEHGNAHGCQHDAKVAVESNETPHHHDASSEQERVRSPQGFQVSQLRAAHIP